MSQPRQALIDDPVEVLTRGHEQVTAWSSGLRRSFDLLTQEEARPIGLDASFLNQVREHVLFVESTIFPKLLEVAPEGEVPSLVSDLRRTHLELLRDCGRLFMDLAGCLAVEDSAQCVLGTRSRAIGLSERVLAHTARERAQLLPLVQHHLQALQGQQQPA
jgi:hypothetical protein